MQAERSPQPTRLKDCERKRMKEEDLMSNEVLKRLILLQTASVCLVGLHVLGFFSFYVY